MKDNKRPKYWETLKTRVVGDHLLCEFCGNLFDKGAFASHWDEECTNPPPWWLNLNKNELVESV